MPSATYEAVPEKRLLLACARTRMTSPIRQRVGEILTHAIDWDFLLRAAAENSVMPLLASQLPALAGDKFSPQQIQRLKAAGRAAGIRTLQLTAELIRVIDALRAKGALALPYKGPVVAQQAYGDLALREFEDLDIVLPQRDVTKADGALRELGYKPRYPWILGASAPIPGEYNYGDDGGRVIVELHTEMTLRHCPVPPDLQEMNRRAKAVSLSGHELLTFDPEDTLVLLCVHGSKDFWERISWIADVAEFVQRQANLDWEQVFARANALKATRMVLLGLFLAARTLDAPLPEGVRKPMEADALVSEIATEIEARLLAKSVPVRSAAESFGYRRRMVQGAASSWSYGLRLATAPAEEDWMMVRLPRVLTPLYIVLRPFRLFRKYGAASKGI
jgi:hypothetical protein